MSLTRRGALAGIGATLFGLAAACSGIERKPNESHYEQEIQTSVGKKNVRIVFAFGRHVSGPDANTLYDIVENFRPHVYCMENADVKEEDAQFLEKMHRVNYLQENGRYVSSPKNKDVERALEEAPIERIFTDWYNFPSFKGYEIANAKRVPMLHFLETLSKGSVRQPKPTSNYVDSFFSGNHVKSFNAYKEHHVWWVNSITNRENRIKKNLETLTSDLMQKNPELAKEKEIRIVVRYGTVHTPILHHALKVQPEWSIYRDIRSPSYFSWQNAMQRKVTVAKKQPTEQELLWANISAITIVAASSYFGPFFDSKAEGNFNAVTNNELRKLKDYDAFARISKRVARAPAGLSQYERLRLAAKPEGIHLPENLDELRPYLEKRGIHPAV